MNDLGSPRTYRCTNHACDHYGRELIIRGTPRGPFLEWPNLRCVCGVEPMIVDSQIVLGASPHAGLEIESGPLGLK